jgi:hypothetical protein
MSKLTKQNQKSTQKNPKFERKFDRMENLKTNSRIIE